jgi:hypothetical protein
MARALQRRHGLITWSQRFDQSESFVRRLKRLIFDIGMLVLFAAWVVSMVIQGVKAALRL